MARRKPLARLSLIALEDRMVPAFAEFLNPDPTGGDAFGNSVVTLSNGNVVITSPNDDVGGTNVGAVYLYNGSTGALISTLRGSRANDTVGSGGITALPSGNFLIQSPNWDSATGVADVGAVTFVNGTTGLSGAVSASNSLVGATAGDAVGGTGITVLANGNYLVRSANFDFVGTVDSGAVTFGKGTTGISGVVSASNSLVCTAANTQIGNSLPQELTNGNYIVRSDVWDNGAATNAGAVTWGSGTTGVSGIISASNSLVGSAVSDNIGGTFAALLPNGDYVVVANGWDNGGVLNAGAVTLCDGSTGRVGAVSASNSLVGSTASDQVGSDGITVLPNGNFLVRSSIWDNAAAANAGAVTFVNSTTGLVGTVSTANSLVGSTAIDSVGSNAPLVLANGNYVVRTNTWDNGAAANAGAVTWGSGVTGVSGAIAAANSLVGTIAGEQVGSSVTALPNGNYVAATPLWSGAAASAGAVTWCNGLTGRVGSITSANSLVGAVVNDQVGSVAPTVLTNGNFVFRSPLWDNGVAANVGAVTWVNGITGTTGAISSANSLVGSTASDTIGNTITALANGNYVVSSPQWDNGVTADVGASTWGSGTAGITGTITLANSLIGTSPSDLVGGLAPVVLPNGNYVVRSQVWANGAALNAGFAAWSNGNGGTVGTVNSSNALVGSTTNDGVGTTVTPLTNGNYIVATTGWDNGAVANAGAVTWGNGTAGVVGIVGSANSLVGSAISDNVGSAILLLPNGNYVVGSANWDNGAVANAGAATWGSGIAGVQGAVTAANSLVGTTAGDSVGGSLVSLGNGNYSVRSTGWDNGAATNAGAVTFGNGTTGVSGAVSGANSLVGSAASDQVGNNVLTLADGDYIVTSDLWDYGSLADSGAVTWGSGTTGVSGAVGPANSLLGLSGTAGLNATPITDDVNDTFIARFTIENFGGKVRIGSQSSGVIPTLSTVYVDDGFAALTPGSSIADADLGTAGSQPARYGENAFANIPDALSRLVDGGTMILNTGTYAEDVALVRNATWNLTGAAATVSGVISGAFGLPKTGPGTLVLTGVNTFAGTVEVQRGALSITSDANLGNAANPVVLSAAGVLVYNANTSSSRFYQLDGGALFVNAGATLTLTNATIAGGFLRGFGTIAATGTAISNSECIAGFTITSNGASNTFTSFTNRGTFNAAGFTTTTGFVNEVSGVISIPAASQFSAVSFTSLGQISVAGTLSISSQPATFGGGSVTTIDASGSINVGTPGLRVVGGLIKNSGTLGTGTGTVTVDYNARVQGTGLFGPLVTQNGGVFAPGASPGTATTNQFNLNGGGRLEFEVTNASGTPGVVSGWDLVNVQPTPFSATGLMNYTSTSTDKYVIQLKSRLDDGIGNTPGNSANFNSALSYAWKFADGSNPGTTSSGSFSASNFSIDTSGFSNSFTGGFGVELRDGGKNLYVVYTPVAGPVVNSFTVNGGNVQRSRLTTIAVNFAAPVDASLFQSAGAITLTRTAATASGTVGTLVDASNGLIVSPSAGFTSTLTLTFANTNTAGLDFASLDDGRWQLAIPSAGFSSTGGDTTLRRLFGDFDNNGTVDATDFSFFPAFGASSNSPFDFNNNNDIDATDFAQFGNRVGVTL